MAWQGGFQDSEDKGPFARTATAFGRGALVLVVLAGLFLLNLVPLNLGHFDSLRPPFLLMAVFYWTIFRPALLVTPIVFILGLLMDIVSGWPPGVSALLLVCVQWVTLAQRKFFMGQSFMTVWWGYFLISIIVGLLQWAVFSLFALDWLPVMPVVAGVVLGGLLFPFAALPLYLVHRILSLKPGLINS